MALTSPAAEALGAVSAERDRQEDLYTRGELTWIASNPSCPDSLRLFALVEEVGEVGRALHDNDDVARELVHVAAVAVAWLEALAQTRMPV